MLWSNLRNILQSKFATATIAIPLIGFAILFNEKFINLVNLAPEYGLKTDPSSSQHIQIAKTAAKLYFYYFGFTLIAVSALIYKFRAPAEVQSFPDSLRFEADRFDRLTLTDIRFMIKDILTFNNEYLRGRVFKKAYDVDIRTKLQVFSDHIYAYAKQSVPSEADKIYADLKSGTITHHFTNQFLIHWQQNYSRETLRYFYDAKDASRLWPRIFSSLFFALGSLLVAVPTIKTFFVILFKALPELGAWLIETFPTISNWVLYWMSAL